MPSTTLKLNDLTPHARARTHTHTHTHSLTHAHTHTHVHIQVMKGYLGEPDKTAECVTDDGWLLTGDIAKVRDIILNGLLGC